MDNKYEIRANGRIVALRDGSWGPTGTVGGYVAHEGNLGASPSIG